MRVKSAAYVAALMTGSLVPCAAFAATLAVATTDLNIRSGPGPEYPVTGAIAAHSQATIESCVQGSRWCQVTYRGKPGWAYTQYMQAAAVQAPASAVQAPARTVTEQRTVVTRQTISPSGTAVVTEQRAPTTITTVQPAPAPVITEAASQFGVPAIVYERPAGTVGLAPADIDESLIDAPAGPVVTSADAELAPPESVQSYVVHHPLNPVYLNGEVVVGAGLPPTVALQPVPDYDYDYAYVNRQPVLVEPRTRRIVYVYR